MLKSTLYILPFIRSFYIFKFPVIIFIVLPIFLNKIIKKKLTFILFYLLISLYVYWFLLAFFTPTKLEDNIMALLISFSYALLGILAFSNFKILKSNANNFAFLLLFILIVSIFGYFIAILNYENSFELWIYSTSRNDLANTWASFAFIDKTSPIPRLSGFFLDPNRWGGILFFIFIIILTLKNDLTKKQNLLLIILMSISILLTQSRSIYIAVLLFLFFNLILNFKIKTLSKIFLLVIFVSASLLTLNNFIPLFDNDFLIQRFTSVETDSENARGRGQILLFYLNYLFSNNLELFGNGFELITDKYYLLGTHNTFNYIFFSSGIFGLIPIICIYSFLLIVLFKKIKIERIKLLTASLPSFVVIFLLEDYFFTPLFFGVFAYYFGVIYYEKNTNIHA